MTVHQHDMEMKKDGNFAKQIGGEGSGGGLVASVIQVVGVEGNAFYSYNLNSNPVDYKKIYCTKKT